MNKTATNEQTAVHIDPRSFDASALGGINSAEVRIAITGVVLDSLLKHGVTTRKGRHAVGDYGLQAEIWPRVRHEPCLADGTPLEQVLRRWPAADAMTLGRLVRVLLNASARRAALEQELRALDAVVEIRQIAAPDPTIALGERLRKDFPAEIYDPTGKGAAR